MKRVIRLVLVSLLCLSLINCSDSSSGSGSDNGTASIDEFSFDASSNTALDRTVSCTISETAISCQVPCGTDVTALVATFTTTGESVTVGENTQESGTTANDFISPVTYTVTAADGTTQDYTVSVSTSQLSMEAYIKADNNDADDYFGYSVSLDGDTLAVGAYNEDSNQTTITSSGSADSSNSGSGAVYIYTRSGTDWSMQAYIKADNNDADDYFGYSVSLDGDTLAVGAYNEDSNQTTITSSGSADNSSGNSGAVYVYTRSGTDWSMQAYIKADNNDANDGFGGSVSLDGDTLAVSAAYEYSDQITITLSGSADNSNRYSGAVYVYTRSGTDWSMQAYIKADNNDVCDYFGRSVSLDGDTLAVGVAYEDSDQTTITPSGSADNSNFNSGAVYVYTRSGIDWSMQAFIKADNNDADDQFGYSVSLDGDTLAVGARNEASDQTTSTSSGSADNSSDSSGAVYVYTRSGTDWSMRSYIKADNNDADDQFGYSVSLDGDTLAVGARNEASDQTTITPSGSADNGSDSSGAVYIYR